MGSLSSRSLIEIAGSIESAQAYRSHSSQLVSFAAVAIIYGAKTNWAPTKQVSLETRDALRAASEQMHITKTAHETFIGNLRDTVKKLCDHCYQEPLFIKVQTATSEKEALEAMLGLLASKNIFTASHMRIWSRMDTTQPLDLNRNSGDSAKFKRGELR
ncbi:hypothetical protein [Methylorubrum aminovorans]|uniref:hypothetical protein n=1 Tax=Methylorubrum aminovorans TaxID=269069 RepID=UPI003C2C27A8